MTIWIDAQLSPALAPWIKNNFGVEAFSARWLGLQYATDEEIFDAARKANAVVMSKDSDFVQLLNLHGSNGICGLDNQAQLYTVYMINLIKRFNF